MKIQCFQVVSDDMKSIFVFLLLTWNSSYSLSFRGAYPFHEELPAGPATGDPLFLTPYIDAGEIQEGQKAAEVCIKDTDVTGYSGFFTVNKTHNSNLFFWSFPAEVDPENAPVVLWLQGGPGGPSVYGLFCENGPFFVDKDGRLEDRNTSWAKIFNMIYIDNPVGTGFSFTDNEAGYATNEVDVGRDLYSALYQYFTLFPELQKNDFFITGESYAGKYVPAAAFAIHNNNKNSSLKINLKGLAMGDGWTAPEYMLDYGDYLYQLGLIDNNTKEQFNAKKALALKYIKQKDYHKSNEVVSSIIGGKNSLYGTATGLKSYYNYVLESDNQDCGDYAKYLQSDGARKSLHVGDITFNNGQKTADYLYNDTMHSVKPWIEVLIEDYRILFYNGQLDIICAYPLTVNVLQHLNWSGAPLYKTAPRKQWIVDGEVAGYFKTVKSLTEVLVRNSGHMVPHDKPEWAFDMIRKFAFNITF